MKTALVTGASRGIGRSVTLELARAGYQVLALGRDRAALTDVMREAEELAGAVLPLVADLSDHASLADTLAPYARPDTVPEVLVNNAGLIAVPGPFVESDPTANAAMVAVNVTAQIALTRMVLPAMRERGDGHIFFTGSIAGHRPAATLAVYSATKAAMTGFCQALRSELAGTGPRITEIVPGRVETELYKNVLSDTERAALYDDGTAIQPQDVARMLKHILDMPANADVVRFDILPGQKP